MLRDAIGPDGTLVMPSWSDEDDEPLDPKTTPSAPSLGVVADTFWRLPDAHRSDHFFAFAAAGPRAAQIVADPLPLPPHRPESPVGRVHELNGQVLLLGVGHVANTTLHLVELLANVPYGVSNHCTVVKDGRKQRIDYLENDHCCERFALADGWLRADNLQAEGKVGHAHARLIYARDVINTALPRMITDPLVFLHPSDHGCAECDRARSSVAK
jgi:aminoglycoside 3-N-acetyltransferase-4